MARAHLFQEWRDLTRYIKYPFMDSATLVNSVGDTIPENLFSDARLYPVGGGAGQFLSRVTIDDDVVIAISDASGEIATGTFDFDTEIDVVKVLDLYGRPAGVFVSSWDRLQTLVNWAPGDHEFERAQTEFAAAVVVPQPIVGVNGIVLADATVFTGEVILVGHDGIVLREDGGTVRVDIVGDPYYLRKLCAEEEVERECVQGLKTINAIAAVDGRFTITAGDNLATDTVLRVTPTTDGLRLTVVGQKGI